MELGERPKWLICGCGYLGTRVARRWQEAGGLVFATTRHLVKSEQFLRHGWVPLVGDWSDPQRLPALPDVEWAGVLFALGREPGSAKRHEELFVGGLQHLFQQLGSRRPWLAYVSSTGVYGEAAGEWLDERSEVAPATPGGRASWLAEQQLAQYAGPHTIFRMAGLYGPGRVPRQADLQSGLPLAVAADGYLNLIHVDDAADVIVAVAARTRPPTLLCVSDGHPVPRREYLREVARQLHVPLPTFVEPPPDAPRGRGNTNKRIDNRQLQALLDHSLQYPDYRAGLRACLAAHEPG